MARSEGDHRKAVGALDSGDETLDYGIVEHREGRKVWFVTTTVTFPSLDDEVEMTATSLEDLDGR